ncbi:MAG: hypothetical protein ACRDRK_04295 [Pseudonocardia sp.]
MDSAPAGRTAAVIAHRFTRAVAADPDRGAGQGRIVETGRHGELVAVGANDVASGQPGPPD